VPFDIDVEIIPAELLNGEEIWAVRRRLGNKLQHVGLLNFHKFSFLPVKFVVLSIMDGKG
jgi:hypothetical protein